MIDQNMQLPDSLLYSDQHLWVQKTTDGIWLAGITDYAQDLLGDLVYLEPPKIDSAIENGQPCGIVESVKTGSDLHAPMNGIVTEVNEALLDAPEEINDHPYQSWIFKFKPSDCNETEHLLDADAYSKLTGE